jgi:hypothetical protein
MVHTRLSALYLSELEQVAQQNLYLLMHDKQKRRNPFLFYLSNIHSKQTSFPNLSYAPFELLSFEFVH